MTVMTFFARALGGDDSARVLGAGGFPQRRRRLGVRALRGAREVPERDAVVVQSRGEAGVERDRLRVRVARGAQVRVARRS